MFKVMQKSNIDLNTTIYNTIVHGMCVASKLDEAWSLFLNLLHSGLQPDVQTYSILINALLKAGNFVGAEKLYSEMIRMGVVPNTITFNTMIDGLCKQNRLDEAKHFLCSYEPKLNVGSISFIARKHNVRADLLAKGACSQNFIFFDVNSLI
ncbi:BnaCnng78770D, partial [Brassica napus]